MEPKSTVIRIEDIKTIISRFSEYLIVDEQIQPRVAKDYRNIARRFLRFSEGRISRESIRGYLGTYLSKAPKTYNNQLDGLRAFILRFLRHPELMEGFKKACENQNREVELPTRKQLRNAFEGLSDSREKAIFLFYASTGLRRSEVLNLSLEDIDFEMRAVRSKHNTRTKKAGITFYNDECEIWLRKYLNSRKEISKVFDIGPRAFIRIWKKATKASGIKITPQILRIWFSTEMGELGVPDRYVDVFQGRAPKTVLAKFYTGKELHRLKRIYKKAALKLLS